MPSKKPFIFSYNTGNDNTAVHMDAPCPVKDVPIYFAIIDGNLYVSMGIARRLYGNAIAGNYLRNKVKENEKFALPTRRNIERRIFDPRKRMCLSDTSSPLSPPARKS